jgi:hypothetical protein
MEMSSFTYNQSFSVEFIQIMQIRHILIKDHILICNKAEIDKKFLFLVTAAILNGGRGCRTQY